MRQDAAAMLAKGRFAQAEVLFRQLCLHEPRDPQMRIRHAEALRKVGRLTDAKKTYQLASRLFADAGHLARAAAALKLALEIARDDVDLIGELIRLEMRRNATEREFRPTPRQLDVEPEVPKSEAGVEARPLLALPALPEPATDPGVAVEPDPEVVEAGYPIIRRLSDREIAFKPSSSSKWFVVSSTATLAVSIKDTLEEEPSFEWVD